MTEGARGRIDIIIKFRELNANIYIESEQKRLAYDRENWRKSVSKDRDKETRRAHMANRKQKQIVISAYGGKCACCSESDIRFLTIDHINGGGNKHIKELKNQHTSFYTWLVENEFPEGFQVLCWNCNMGRQHNNGVCPHMDNYSMMTATVLTGLADSTCVCGDKANRTDCTIFNN